jgi:hypothetical protein
MPTDRMKVADTLHARTHSRTHQYTVRHEAAQCISPACLPALLALCTAVPVRHPVHRLYMRTVLLCGEFGGQTDRRPQFYAFIVYTSVNTFISFKNDSIKQRNPVHCGTFIVFWKNPKRSECRALRKQEKVQCGKWLPACGPETSVFIRAM